MNFAQQYAIMNAVWGALSVLDCYLIYRGGWWGVFGALQLAMAIYYIIRNVEKIGRPR